MSDPDLILNKTQTKVITREVYKLETMLNSLEQCEANSNLQELYDELEEAYENMSDNMKDGDKGQSNSEARDKLEDVREKITEAREVLTDAVTTLKWFGGEV